MLLKFRHWAIATFPLTCGSKAAQDRRKGEGGRGKGMRKRERTRRGGKGIERKGRRERKRRERGKGREGGVE